VNFAFGGAQTGFAGAGDFGELLPGVLTQVEWFTDDLDQQLADPNALYIVWAGANDYQTVEAPNPEVSVGNLKTAVESLFNVGARNFLVPNLPDLGKTARALTLGSEASSNLTALTNAHNFSLATTLNDLSQSLTDINLVPLDVYSLLNDAIANPTAFGFTNVTQACLDPVTLIPCTNPNEYLFWDGIHPTTVTHEQLSEFALTALMAEAAPVAELPSEPVPQPQSFATLRFEVAPVAALESEPESVPEPTSSLSLGVLGIAWLLWGRFNS
jgi:phospholipase/lecithinase/hemolysin